MSKAARWLDLIAFLLQHRFPVTRGQIFQSVDGYGLKGIDPDAIPPSSTELESARRKFERDKDELRALGLDLETIELADRAGDEASTGYRLRTQGIYLPYLEFDEADSGNDHPYAALQRIEVARDELELLDRATYRLAEHPSVPLRAAARSARRKLGFDLPLTVQQIERVLGESGRDEPNDALEVLQQAVARHTRVSCRYYTIGRDAEDSRTLEPYGLFEREPEHVVVRFGFPDARWVVAQGVGEVREPYTDDGGAVVAFSVRERAPFLRWLLTFGDRAVIDEPATVADDLDQLRERVATLYADHA
jgi:predicted DNA-binding transcriptional regulator YafY